MTQKNYRANEYSDIDI